MKSGILRVSSVFDAHLEQIESIPMTKKECNFYKVCLNMGIPYEVPKYCTLGNVE